MSDTPAPRTDWSEARRIYCEGEVSDAGERTYPSVARIAWLFDVEERRVIEHRNAEAWDNERAVWQAHMRAVQEQRRLEAQAKESVDFDTRALGASKAGMALTQMRLTEVLQKYGEVRKAQDAVKKGTADEDQRDLVDGLYGMSPVDAKELVNLAAALETLQRVGRKALGEVETTRTEVTGAGGAPLEVQSSVKAELLRDDADRGAQVLAILLNNNLLAQPEDPQMIPGALGAITAVPDEGESS